MKIVIVGDESVGKSSLVRNICGKTYIEKYSSTYGVKVSKFEIEGKEDLEFWDCGSGKRSGLIDGYFINANCAIIVFDLANVDSFRTIHSHVRSIKFVCENIPIVMCGNKADLLIPNCLERFWERASRIAKKSKLLPFKVSSNTGEGVESLYEYLNVLSPIVKPPSNNDVMTDIFQSFSNKLTTANCHIAYKLLADGLMSHRFMRNEYVELFGLNSKNMKIICNEVMKSMIEFNLTDTNTNNVVEKLRWFVKTFNLDSGNFNERNKLFCFVCECVDDLDVIVWFHSFMRITKEDAMFEQYSSLKYAVEKNNMEIVRWLTETFDIRKSDLANYSWIFRKITENENTSTMLEPLAELYEDV